MHRTIVQQLPLRKPLLVINTEFLQIKPDILEYLDERGVSYQLASNSENILSRVDVAYQTRIDRERLKGKDVDFSLYNIDRDVLKVMKYNSIIMHPLPRSVEIDPAVDSDPRAAYFRQARNGLFVRMALLTMIFENDNSNQE